MVDTQGMSPYRFLLCDDDASYRRLVQLTLSDTAHRRCQRPLEFVEANDGRECVDKVAATEPDLVLLDLNMPAVDGYETLRRLGEQGSTAKVVVLSSATSEEAEERVLDAGAVAFLEKPRDIMELPGLLREKLAA